MIDSLVEPISGIVLDAGNILTTTYTQNVARNVGWGLEI